ncbi:MAG: S8 family peptidase [Bacteroidota bacterium]
MAEYAAMQQNVLSVGPYSLLAKRRSNGTVLFDVIVYASSPEEARGLGVTPNSVLSKFFTAQVTAKQLVALSNAASVNFIKAPHLRHITLDKSTVDMNVDKVHAGAVGGTPYKGYGVIVGIFDTGIDWHHLDFRSSSDTTKSRILYLWDQTDSSSGFNPSGYSYGVEYTQSQINAELGSSPPGFVKEKDLVGHGTHVAGIAAGNGASSGGVYTGVAPEADLIIVNGYENGFSSSHIIDGMTYIKSKALALGKPFVINLSLGGQDGAHDGSEDDEVAMDEIVSGNSGCEVVVAAGNSGGGAIHVDGSVALNQTQTYAFTIPAYTPAGGIEGDIVVLSMWYQGGDNLTVKVTSPDNNIVGSSYLQDNNSSTADGYIEADNASHGLNASDDMNDCEIILTDYPSATPVPKAGTWTVSITGTLITEGGAFDIWIAEASMSPVVFTNPTYTKLLTMPGTTKQGITVGSYETKYEWTAIGGPFQYSNGDNVGNYSTFSSVGPTRDGREKPNISAPGQAIASAYSSTSPFNTQEVLPGEKYVIDQGTSMAAPHVTGMVALMLQANPTATASSLTSAINSSGRKDAFTGSGGWSPQWGNGKADAVAAIETLTVANPPLPVEVSSFTATVQNRNVALVWKVMTELNNYGFKPERRGVGSPASSWVDLTFVRGDGTAAAPKEYSYTDINNSPGEYLYRLKQIDNDGAFRYSQELRVKIDVPKVLALSQNYPDPFNPSTNIQFIVPADGRATLKVFNTLGQEVATLFDGAATAGENHHATFDASRLASGIYFSRLEYDGKVQVIKMLLLK